MISPQYAAGFFDGEGCICITRSGKRGQMHLGVTITNTNIEILQLFQAQFGGKIHTRQLNPKWKPCSQWIISERDTVEFIRFIRPYVKIKTAQIDLAIEFHNFMSLPKNVRCKLIPSGKLRYAPNAKKPFMPHYLQRTEETIKKESEYKEKMNLLNKKGTSLNVDAGIIKEFEDKFTPYER